MAKGRFPMGGMPGGGNMANMIKQAQKMQENILKAQQEIEEATYDISAGGGAVSLTINGSSQITKLQINPDVVDPDDVEMLEDMVLAALQDALTQAEELSNELLGPLAGAGGMF